MSIFVNYFGPDAGKPEIKERFDDCPPVNWPSKSPDLADDIQHAADELKCCKDTFIIEMDIANAFRAYKHPESRFCFVMGDHEKWREYIDETLADVESEIESVHQTIDESYDYLTRLIEKKGALYYATGKGKDKDND